MRGLKVPEWTTHNYTSANSLSHSLYIFSMRTYHSPHIQHKTYIYIYICMGSVPSCISLPPLLKSFLPLLNYGLHTILMKLLPSNQTLQLGTTDRSNKTNYLTSHMCMQDKECLYTHYAHIMYTTIKIILEHT